jgi:hypothetical protein
MVKQWTVAFAIVIGALQTFAQSLGDDDVFTVAKPCNFELFPKTDTLTLEPDYTSAAYTWGMRGGDSSSSRDRPGPHRTYFSFSLQGCNQKPIDDITASFGSVMRKDSGFILAVPDRPNAVLTLNCYSKRELVFTKKFAIRAAMPPPRKFTSCDCDSQPARFFLFDSIPITDGAAISKADIKRYITRRNTYNIAPVSTPKRDAIRCYWAWNERLTFSFKDKDGKHRVNEKLGLDKSVWRKLASKRMPVNTTLTLTFKYHRSMYCKKTASNNRLSPAYLDYKRDKRMTLTLLLQ